MTTLSSTWAEVFAPGTTALLIVNSAPSQLEEIERAVSALERSPGLGAVSAIAPLTLRTWLSHRGVDTSRTLFPRIAGVDVELDYFLERSHAIRWAIRRRADFVLGTEPHAPLNEDVKTDFERRAALMLGRGCFVAHSVPSEQTLLFSAEELWSRAARPEAVERHRARVKGALDRLHRVWAASQSHAAESSASTRAGSIAADLLMQGASDAPETPAPFIDARRYAYERLNDAVMDEIQMNPARSLRVVTDPPDAEPGSGWLPERLQAVGKPEYAIPGIRLHGTRLVARGHLGDPYAYLLRSRPLTLKRGDTVLAEGCVYRGGVSIGLEGPDGQWASRADVDEPGRFLAAAVAKASGTYALVIANYLKGSDHRSGLVLHRFGWARAR